MKWSQRFSALKISVAALVLAATIPTQSAAQGRIDPRLVGEWQANVLGSPIPTVLHVEANGRCGLDEDVGTCQAQGGVIIFKTSEGESRYAYKLQGGTLTVSGGDLIQPLVFRRIGAGPGSEAGPVAGPGEDVEEAPQPTQPPVPRSGGLAGLGGQATPQVAPASRPAGQKRGLTESEVIQLLEGGVPHRRVMDLVEERGISFSVTPAAVSRLKAKGATDQLIAALPRAGSAQAGGAPATGTPSGLGGLSGLGQVAGTMPSRPSAMAQPRRASPGGPRYSYDKWGLSFVVPPGWKVGERQGALLLGSDSEAGLMLIRFVRKTNLQTLAEGYQEGLQEEGLQLRPASQLENFAAGGAQGLAGEMAGMSNDGYQIQARVIGVQSPFGDAAVVLGLTRQEKYPQLRPRVEALAATLSFTQPKAAPVNESVAGQYAYFYSSSIGGSYSRQDLLNLCYDGRFNRGGEIYSSGDAGIALGQSGNAGQWSADGDDGQGTITLTYNNGRTEQIEYQKAGADIIFSGKKYARYGDGTCTQRNPFE